MITSPMATGNGAYIVHSNLAKKVNDYQLCGYNPYLTLFPPWLWTIGRTRQSKIIHTSPDYGLFHYHKGTPLILSFHGYVIDDATSEYSTFLQKMHHRTVLRTCTKLSVKLASEITAVSQYTADLVEQDLELTKKVRVIYNGVNEKMFYPKSLREAHGNNIRVLYCGNLSRRKGAHLLLPILERLNTNISIVYTTGLRDSKRLGSHPRLINVGRVSYEAMPDLYQSADLLLFPTVREGFGLAAAEAMSCGLPVVATNCSSLPELVDDGRGGYLCGLGDVEDFAAKINQLAENISLRRDMGLYNRSKVEEKFTLNRMVQSYEALFQEVLDTAVS